MSAGKPTEEEARIAWEEAGLWYNMVEPFVRDKPVFAQMNARIAQLRIWANKPDVWDIPMPPLDQPL